MIQTENLTKRYGSFTAVAGIDLHIPPGEIYGFLGPNGAGKTTTIMMLLGVVKPTAGAIRLFDQPYSPRRLDLRRRIGVVPEKHPAGMWTWMTAGEYLQMFAELFEVQDAERRIDRLLERVGLAQVKHKRFAQFSRGMLQKLSIVRALLHDPDILFLDEPISGLDPFGIKQIRDLILEESREGRTIFISSHLLSEMEKVCQRVAIIYGGRLLAEDKMASLLTTLAKDREIHVDLEEVPPDLTARVEALPFVQGAARQENTLIVKVAKSGDSRRALSKYLIDQQLVPLSIQEKSLSLEEAFVAITSENVDLFAGMGGPGRADGGRRQADGEQRQAGGEQRQADDEQRQAGGGQREGGSQRADGGRRQADGEQPHADAGQPAGGSQRQDDSQRDEGGQQESASQDEGGGQRTAGEPRAAGEPHAAGEPRPGGEA